MSKLCCLICHQLLSTLAGPGDNTPSPLAGPFGIRGFHTVISTTELPPWLPNDTIEVMLSHFGQILFKELAPALAEPSPVTGGQPGTTQKQNNLSALSSVVVSTERALHVLAGEGEEESRSLWRQPSRQRGVSDVTTASDGTDTATDYSDDGDRPLFVLGVYRPEKV